MKKVVFFLLAICTLYSCKKDELVKTVSYADLVYEINNDEDSLYIIYSRAVYNDSVKGNIDFDTVITQPGIYYINSRVLVGNKVMLYAYTEKGDGFGLRIKDEDGATLAQTDTVTHSPANQLHPEYWMSKLEITP